MGAAGEARGAGEAGGAAVARAASPPPDGGWSWVVLGAVFLTMSLSLPLPQLLGVFFAVLQDEFSASAETTAWVPACMTATLHAAGPISSALVARIGCRPAVLLGSLCTSMGFILASFSASIGHLYAASVVIGLGICLCFQPALTILGVYFLRRRALANGVASSGSAVGMFLLPLASQALLARYGWRGAFLVVGALVLNCCVCAALMRPVATSVSGGATPASGDARREGGGRNDAGACCRLNEQCREDGAARNEAETLVRNGGNGAAHGGVGGAETERDGEAGCLTDGALRAVSRVAGGVTAEPRDGDGTRNGNTTPPWHWAGDRDAEPCCGGDTAGTVEHPALPNRRVPPPPREKGAGRRLWRCLARAAARADLDLFAEPLYGVFAGGTTLMMLGFFVPLVFLVPCAQSLGMGDAEAAALLSVNGLINIFGRPLAGWIAGTTTFRGRSVYLYGGAAFLSGLNDVLCGLLVRHEALLPFCICHGLTCSVVGGLVFTIVSESIPSGERFAAALGLFTVLESVSFLAGPPAAGFLVDYTGEYSVVFITCGAIVMVASSFVSIGTYAVRRRVARHNRATAAAAAAAAATTATIGATATDVTNATDAECRNGKEAIA